MLSTGQSQAVPAATEPSTPQRTTLAMNGTPSDSADPSSQGAVGLSATPDAGNVASSKPPTQQEPPAASNTQDETLLSPGISMKTIPTAAGPSISGAGSPSFQTSITTFLSAKTSNAPGQEPPQAASQDSRGVTAPAKATGSMISGLSAGDFVTIETVDSNGNEVPAIGFLTTGVGGSLSTDFVSYFPSSAIGYGSAPTSTMSSSPLGLSLEAATHSGWTTNTWITTVAPGSSKETIVPVLVGCAGCGHLPGSGLILWNLPRLPRVQFRIPGLPKIPRFHIPCIHIFGIHIGSCSNPSELPDIITDPQEPNDPEPDDPEPSNTEPSASNSDSEPSSTGSESIPTSTLGLTQMSSSSFSSSQSSTNPCSNSITISGTAICSFPTLRAVIDYSVAETASMPSFTGSLKTPTGTPQEATATAPHTFLPTPNMAILSSLSIWANESPLSSMSSTSSPQALSTGSVVSSSSVRPPSTTALPPPSTTAPPPSPTPTLVPPYNPPGEEFCNPPPSGKYTDVDEDSIKDEASYFCTKYKTTPIDVPNMVNETGILDIYGPAYNISVQVIDNCDFIKGATVGEPLFGTGEDSDCDAIMHLSVWKDCSKSLSRFSFCGTSSQCPWLVR